MIKVDHTIINMIQIFNISGSKLTMIKEQHVNNEQNTNTYQYQLHDSDKVSCIAVIINCPQHS